ncbi:MAG TPA: PilZ domain-containing protein [Dongiaceae bacterium]|nr:PilZ domain-containing protein [Dongiaceae bacterium]
MNNPERDPFADRRSSVRKKVLRAARVFFNDRQSLIDCTILDLSDGGAKLEFANRQVLPRTFDLQMQNGAIYRCEVRWAKDNFFGVRFLDDSE